MELQVIWFILIAVLFTGFFVLEGFDYGVGGLLPFISDNDVERQMVLRTITPVWDGNEVWMLTAGGAMFAAFPHAYATMFSGMYLALFLVLLALIVRGAGFDFRNRCESIGWRRAWDRAIAFGSILPAVLWGVAVSNLISGMAIDGNMVYTGGFKGLLSIHSLLGGITFLLVFLFHGAAYLGMRLQEERLVQTIGSMGKRIGFLAAVCYVAFVGCTAETAAIFNSAAYGIFTIGAIFFAAAVAALIEGHFGRSFVSSTIAIVMTTAGVFAGLFPNILVSTLQPAWTLNIYNASSTGYTLTIMTWAAVVFIPIVLLYQAWAYWQFRGRIGYKEAREHY